jgi:hypothetical protein
LNIDCKNKPKHEGSGGWTPASGNPVRQAEDLVTAGAV